MLEDKSPECSEAGYHEGCLCRMFSSLHRAMLELCQSDHRVFYPSGWVASSRKSPGGSKLLPFTDDGGHCAHWDLQYYSLSQRCASIQSCLGGLQTIALTCVLTCTVNYGTFYRKVCSFPNHDKSTEFITVESGCRNFRRMISGNKIHLNSLLRVCEYM